MSFLFGGGQANAAGTAASTAPKVSPTARMPTQSDALTRLAARREQARALGRSGRSSTILTQRGEAGTRAYGNSLLGQTG